MYTENVSRRSDLPMNPVYRAQYGLIFSETLLLPRGRGPCRTQDFSLIRSAQKNPNNFSKIYKLYYRKILEYCRFHIGMNFQVAEEITQEVFLRAFQALPRFKIQQASYLTYLRRIASNLIANYFRKSRPVLMEPAYLETYLSHNPQKQYEARDLLWRIWRSLDPMQKYIFQERYYYGKPVREIAQKLDKTENAVKLILSKTRKRLLLMEKRCL